MMAFWKAASLPEEAARWRRLRGQETLGWGVPVGGVLVSSGSHSKAHTLHELTQNCIYSKFWSLKVQDQEAVWMHPGEDSFPASQGAAFSCVPTW